MVLHRDQVVGGRIVGRRGCGKFLRGTLLRHGWRQRHITVIPYLRIHGVGSEILVDDDDGRLSLLIAGVARSSWVRGLRGLLGGVIRRIAGIVAAPVVNRIGHDHGAPMLGMADGRRRRSEVAKTAGGDSASIGRPRVGWAASAGVEHAPETSSGGTLGE